MSYRRLFAWRGVLAGVYRGRSLSDRSLLFHLVAIEDVAIGRLRRAEGETLCRRVPADHMADQYASGPGELGGEDTLCPRCESMADRLVAQGKAKPV